MKKVLMIIVLFISIFMITGCVQKTGENEKKEARPTVSEGRALSANELEFFLPEELNKSPYNGMLGVYEFYTGELKDAGPTGMDIIIVVHSVDDDFDVEKYANKESSGAMDGAKFKKKNINNHEWYVGEKNRSHYYVSSFHGNRYDISIWENDDPNKVYDDAVIMFEKTLFFEELEAK